MRVLFEEGVSIVGGAIGTDIGLSVGTLLIAPMLCTGPLGFFVVVFICGTIGGIAFSEGMKALAENAYDLSDRVNGRRFYSLDDIVGSF